MEDARHEAEALLARGAGDGVIGLVRGTWATRFGLADVG
jgi:hypothetical protein